MQGQENRDWHVYSNDNIVDLTKDYQTFEDTFTMNEDTDTAAFFSACLGKIGDNQITTQHEVHIDDISLEEVKDDPKDDIKDNPRMIRKMTSRTIQRTIRKRISIQI